MTKACFAEVQLEEFQAERLTRVLRNRQTIEHLDFCSVKFIQSIRALCEGLRRLVSLSHIRFFQCEMEADDWRKLAGLLRDNKHISHVELPENSIDELGVHELVGGFKFFAFGEPSPLLHVHKLVLDGNRMRGDSARLLMEGLKRAGDQLSLFELGLQESLDLESLSTIFDSLDSIKSLQVLDIGRNIIDVAEALKIAGTLLTNATLRTLRMSECQIRDEAIVLISKALENTKSLTEVDLSKNEFQSVGWKSLCVAIKSNPKFPCKVHLHGNIFDADFMIEMAEVLRNNSSLIHLSVGHLSSDGIYADNIKSSFIDIFKASCDILSALKYNTVLKSLYLDFNGYIEATVCKMLGEMLYCNTSIISLVINNAILDGEADEEWVRCFAYNVGIKKLFFRDCDISAKVLKALAQSLQHNNSIDTLSIDIDYAISEDATDALVESLQTNTSLIRCDSKNLTRTESFMERNRAIHDAVRSAALFLIGIRRTANRSGQGLLANIPKDVVTLLAKYVWATRADIEWLEWWMNQPEKRIKLSTD